MSNGLKDGRKITKIKEDLNKKKALFRKERERKKKKV